MSEEIPTVTVAERSTLPKTFSLAEELFCAEVAVGTGVQRAAVMAGYAAEYSSGLLRKPEIVARIKQMLDERITSNGVMSKTWAELQFVYIIRDAINGLPDEIDLATGKVLRPGLPIDRPLAVAALTNFCKLRGWMIDRKQTLAGKLDLNALNGTGQLENLLDDTLQSLSPEERNRIKQLTERPRRSKALPRKTDVIIDSVEQP